MKKILFSLFALMIWSSQVLVVDAAIARDISCGRFGQPVCEVNVDVDPVVENVRVNVRANVKINGYASYSQRYTGTTYNFLNNSVAGVYTQQVSPVTSINSVKTYVQTKRTDKESFDAYNQYPNYRYYNVSPRYLYQPYNRVVTRTYVRTFPRRYVRPAYTYFY